MWTGYATVLQVDFSPKGRANAVNGTFHVTLEVLRRLTRALTFLKQIFLHVLPLCEFPDKTVTSSASLIKQAGR